MSAYPLTPEFNTPPDPPLANVFNESKIIPLTYAKTDNTSPYTDWKTISLKDDGLELKHSVSSSVSTFTLSGSGFTDGTYNTTLGRLAAVQTAFQAVELPPNATTLKINDTLLCDNGSATTAVSSTSIAMTNPASDIVGSITGNGFNLTTDATGSSVGTSAVNASAINSAGTLQSSLSGSVVNMPSPPYPAPDANWSLSVNSTTNNPSLYLSRSAPFTNTTSMTIDLNNIIHNQSTGSVSPDDNFTISTNKNLILTADNIDFDATGRLLIPNPLTTNNHLDYNAGKLTINNVSVGGASNPALVLQNTNNTAGSVAIETYKNKVNGAQNDTIASWGMFAKDYLGTKTEFARINSTITNSSAGGGNDGAVNIWCSVNGTISNVFTFNGADNENNSFRPLDLTGNELKTSSGNMNINATASTGTGKVVITPKIDPSNGNLETFEIPYNTNPNTDKFVIEKAPASTTFYQYSPLVANSSVQLQLANGNLSLVTINPPTAPELRLANGAFQFASHQYTGTTYNLSLPASGSVKLTNANLDLNGGSLTSTTGTIPINATTLNFQNTSTQTTPANHNVIFYARTNGLQGTNWLKVQLNGNFIWIPYLTIDPNL